jgi:hypothetical protein
MTLAEREESPFPVDIDADQDGRVDDWDDMPDDGVEYGGDLVVVPDDSMSADPWTPPVALAGLERFANRPWPTRHSIYMHGRWWTVTLGKASGQVLVHSPELLIRQVPHICRGIGRWGSSYASWRGQPEWLEAAKIADPSKRAHEIARVKARTRAATRLTNLLLALLAVGIFLAVWFGMVWVLVTVLGMIAAAADVKGRRGVNTSGGPTIIPASSFGEGAPSRMVMADVRAVLLGRGHDEETTVLTDPRVGEYGLSMTLHSQREMTEDDVAAIERGLQTYRGAVSIIADPTNAALQELRMYWRDPLAETFVPDYAPPLSRTIADPAMLGYGVGRTPLLLNLMRTNVLLVGAPGSGKSSALWAIIDWLSSCHDVILHGIDLSGGPALRAWGDVFATRAFDRDSAKALLERRIAETHQRTEMLAERSEPKADGSAPQSENWEPSDGPMHIMIIDELPLLANDPELVALYAEHQRIGRKAGDTSIAASQDLSGDTLGATSLRKYPSTLVMFACSREDVTVALGGGKIKEGWTPHRFTPAEGGAANDAGKCMIKSGRHTKPVPWRFARLDDMREIHRRAIERIGAGRPADDGAILEPDVVDAPFVPLVLSAVEAAFVARDRPEFLSTVDLLTDLAEAGHGEQWRSGKALGAALGRYGVTSDRPRSGGGNKRGYHWTDVAEAIRKI